MTFSQLITPTPSIPAEEGMCLQYVRQTFGLQARYASATEAWLNSASQHRDRNYPKGVWFAVWWALDKNVNGHVALVAPDGRVFSTSNLNPNPLKVHPNVADVEAYYARYGFTLTYRGWTEDVAGTPVISPDGIAAMGETITQPAVEEDDMFNDQDRANLTTALDKANRAAQVADAQEDRGDSAKIALVYAMLSQIAPQFRYVKAPDDGTDASKTLYELKDGNLRGIGLVEWQAKGGAEPVILPQADIDTLLKAGK